MRKGSVYDLASGEKFLFLMLFFAAPGVLMIELSDYGRTLKKDSAFEETLGMFTTLDCKPFSLISLAI